MSTGTSYHPVILGRFQPFHYGHLNLIKQAKLGFPYRDPTIIIGSAQEARTEKNPFSYIQRFDQLTNLIPFNCKYFGLEDNPDNDKWLENLEELLKRASVERPWFYIGFEAEWAPPWYGLLLELKYKVGYVNNYNHPRATQIREFIKQNDYSLVPEPNRFIVKYQVEQIRKEGFAII